MKTTNVLHPWHGAKAGDNAPVIDHLNEKGIINKEHKKKTHQLNSIRRVINFF